MRKFWRIAIFSLLTPFFFSSCNNNQPIIPPLNGDISLLTYDTMTVNYQLPAINNYQENLLEITSSDPSLFTIKDGTSFTNKVIIESNLENKVGNANINFAYDGEMLEYSIDVAVNYPQNMDEAVKAFSLACIKLPANTQFNILLNFYNPLALGDFDASLEIYGWRGIVKYYGYRPGTARELKFEVDTSASYGTTKSNMPVNYQTNIKSFNYYSRSNLSETTVNDSFYIDQVEKSLDVKNSEELFWSVEHGYRPNLPNDNSNLSIIYGAARDICSTINPSWTNLTKYRELFDYLEDMTHYDYGSNLESLGSASMSYYLEGVFLDNGIAVCDGFSKAYALLCGILGLPCFRSYGFPKGENTGHAWNYVQLNGNWYLVCPTWAKIGFNLNDKDDQIKAMAELYGKNISVINYDSFLASKNYFKNMGADYSDLAWPSIKRSDTPYSGNIEEFNYHVTSDAIASLIHQRLVSRPDLLNQSCLYFEFNKNISQSNYNKWINIILTGSGYATNEVKCSLISLYGEDCIYTLICFKTVS